MRKRLRAGYDTCATLAMEVYGNKHADEWKGIRLIKFPLFQFARGRNMSYHRISRRCPLVENHLPPSAVLIVLKKYINEENPDR
jgi:hypothetical protein